MRVSWLTGWPSAVTEIQEVSLARMTRVRLADLSGALGLDLGKVRTVTSFLSSLFGVALAPEFSALVAGDATAVAG